MGDLDMDTFSKKTTVSRREWLAHATRAGLGGAAIASVGLLARASTVSAQAAAKTMAIAIWGGPFSAALREALVPEFEKDHGVKVVMEEGISADAIAKVRTARSNPQHTLIGVDDQFISELKTEGLIVPVTPKDVPNMKDLFPEYVIEDGHGVGVAVSWSGLHYNTARVKTPITSWRAMWDPAFKGRVIIQSFKAGTGILTLAMTAALATGKPAQQAQYEAEAAFPLYKQLRPHLHSIVDSTVTALPLLAQGEAWLLPTPSRIAAAYTVKGAPIARAEVKEGQPMLLNTVALVKNAPLQEQGRDFINRFLSAKVQLEMAKKGLTGPTNQKVEVPADLKKLVPVGREDAARMVRLDWKHVTKHRAQWVDWWNKEMAG
ncbi:MAG: extracellular solute-binding protein [Candidatus Rokubacteria bacterium]|nr:extracellular solute-binding protein [Candidatus Rokubacteria bacterium]